MTQCLSHNGHAPYTQRIGSGDETRIHVLDEHTGERNQVKFITTNSDAFYGLDYINYGAYPEMSGQRES